jgi:hypothetical protein
VIRHTDAPVSKRTGKGATLVDGPLTGRVTPEWDPET